MRHLTAILCLTLAVLLGSAGVSESADYQKGMDAYRRGDYATALRELKPLAQQGNSGAQFYIGEIYELGRGITRNYQTAVKWYLFAAEHENHFAESAQFKLGNLYHTGRGVPQDDKIAVKWWRRAAEKGHASAKNNLKELEETIAQQKSSPTVTAEKPKPTVDHQIRLELARRTQEALQVLGLYSGKLDGIIGVKTRSAIQQWQKRNGYTGTGKVTEAQLAKLEQEAITRLAEKKSEPTKPSATQVPERPDDVAVIIANSNYKKLGKDIPNVDPAYNDAENIKRYFMEALGVREGNIIYLKDATKAQMTSVLGSNEDHRGRLFNWTKPNISKVYIYYAGHGAPAGDRGTTYLVPSDSDSQTVQLTGYPLKQLYRNLGKLPATSITVILEACFSGQSHSGHLSVRTSGISIQPKMPNVPDRLTVISAGAANQVASWEQDESQSLFTKYFLKAMSGDGDRKPYGNGDGKVSLKELKRYLDKEMTYLARRYYGRDQNAQITVDGRQVLVGN